ncbi:MAG: metallophosphoesterase, partial [Coleofasciculaceae cyanobacterium SM2_3_26]|nr:metallophosphoesterase [Coleofasciculaceae cyanobacterium SM2_3_26]
MHVLHLSDLFLASRDRAIFLATHLADDLRSELHLSHLDALILSGNLVQSATPEAYAAVEGFLHYLRREFSLPKEHIVLVPGNSDLDLRLSEEEAYQPVLRRKYRGSLEESAVIDEGGSYLAVLQPEVYKHRFQHFSEFYQTVKDAPYSLEYHQQFTLDHFPNHDVLMLGLNSAWQLDHHYTDRAHIHPSALTNALLAISRNSTFTA